MKLPTLLCAIGILAGPGAARAEDTCQVIGDADRKVLLTPAHLFTVQNMDVHSNIPEKIETIYTGGPDGKVYVMTKGKWGLSKQSAAEQQKQYDATPKMPEICQHLRDESVNGEAASVYISRRVFSEQSPDGTPGASIEATTWISKSTGLPLRRETDMSVGGPGGKGHWSIRYDYVHVQPPQI